MKGKAEIRQFVKNLLAGYGDNEPFGDADSLISSGRLQSIDAVEIVMFLEREFAVDFAQIGFDRDRLESIDAIHALVQETADGNEERMNS